jgi:hypothetical protein
VGDWIVLDFADGHGRWEGGGRGEEMNGEFRDGQIHGHRLLPLQSCATPLDKSVIDIVSLILDDEPEQFHLLQNTKSNADTREPHYQLDPLLKDRSSGPPSYQVFIYHS